MGENIRDAFILLAIVIFIAGLSLGFFAGKKYAIKNLPPQEDATINTSIPETEPETPSLELPTTIYYDCPLSEELQDHIRMLCEGFAVPMPLVIAQIQVESNYIADVISPTGDYGLMQINKINHRRFEREYGITDFLDPYQNVFCGIKMLSESLSCYGDLDKALMAYNLGIGGAQKLWRQGIYTSSYVEKIKNAMEMLQIKESA